MSMHSPTDARTYDALCESIKQHAGRPPFSVPAHRRIELAVPIAGAHLYDAVHVYARAATRVLADGGDVRNGRAIMRYVHNTTYRSVLGFDVRIDANGDAEGNYTVIAALPTTKTPVGGYRMQPVGYFTNGVDDADGNGSEEDYAFRYIDPIGRSIRWIDGRPPVAEPPCGFDNAKCRAYRIRMRLFGVSVAVAVAIAAAFTWRHYRYEQQLAGAMWKVDAKEVTIVHGHGFLDCGEFRGGLIAEESSVGGCSLPVDDEMQDKVGGFYLRMSL